MNPPDFVWGNVDADSATGAYKELREGKVDIVGGCHKSSQQREQESR